MTSPDPLRPDAILLDLPGRTRMEILAALATRVAEIVGGDPLAIRRALTAREQLGSTGVGAGVALPHAELAGLDRAIAIFARPARPVDWEAIDDRPVELVVAVLSPPNRGDGSPNLLARLARLLRNPETRRRLATCTSLDRAFEIFAGES